MCHRVCQCAFESKLCVDVFVHVCERSLKRERERESECVCVCVCTCVCVRVCV